MTVETSIYNKANCGREVPLAPDDGGDAADVVDCTCGRKHIVVGCPANGKQMVPRATWIDEEQTTLSWWCPWCEELHTSNFDWAAWSAYLAEHPEDMM